MKLFRIHNICVNEHHIRTYVDDCILSVGKRYMHKTINVDTSLIYDGWYIRVELPIPKTVTYMCANEFINKTGKCRKVFLWFKRPKYNHITKTSVWKPI